MLSKFIFHFQKRFNRSGNMKNNLLWQLFISCCGDNYKAIYNETPNDQKKRNFQNVGLLYDMCFVLIEFNMERHYNIKEMQLSKKDFNAIINEKIIEMQMSTKDLNVIINEKIMKCKWVEKI